MARHVHVHLPVADRLARRFRDADTEQIWRVKMYQRQDGRGMWQWQYVRAATKEAAIQAAVREARGSDYPYAGMAEKRTVFGA